MEEILEKILDSQTYVIAGAALFQLFSILLESLSRRQKAAIGRFIHVGAFVLGAGAIVTFLSYIFAISISEVSSAMTSGSNNFDSFMISYLILFGSAAILVHILAYVFSGLLHRIPFFGRLWPKGIDYIYYSIGALLVLSIVAEVMNQQGFVSDVIKLEVMGSALLLNFKIFRTSYDVFETFKWKDGWVRIWYVGQIL